MIVYDDAGYIAGVQSVLLERDVDLDVNDLTKQASFIRSNFFLLIGERIYRIDLVILIIHIIICNINLLFCTASVCSRLMDGRGGLVHHRLLCRPPCHLQRRKVADQHFGGNF